MTSRPAASRALLALGVGWVVAAVVVWLARGWILWSPAPAIPTDVPWEAPTAQARALAAVALFLACCWGMGAALARALRLEPRGGRALVIAHDVALGLCAAALALMALGFCRLLPWGMLVLLGGLAGLPAAGRRLASAATREAAWLETRLLAAVGAALVVASSLAPAVESDGLRYHLFLPQEWLKAGGIIHLPLHALTNLPSMAQVLFLPAMEWGGMRGPQVLHGATWLLLAVFAGALGERVARASVARRGADPGRARRVGLAAGLAGAASPVCVVVAGWPNVDVASAAFLVAGVWALCPGSLRRLDGRLLAGSLFLGAAAACKLPAAAPGALAGVMMLAVLLRRPRAGRRIALLVLPGVLMLGPWLAKNVVIHGNPVYPAGYSVFGGPEWSPANDAFYKGKAAEKGIGRSPVDFALFPLDVTIRWRTGFGDPLRRQLFLEGNGYLSAWDRVWSGASPGFEDHNPGPALLALLPLALAAAWIGARRRSFTLLLVAGQVAGGALVWFLAYQSVRFLIPVLVLNAVLAAGALARWPAWASRGALGALAALGLAWAGWYLGFVAPTRPLASAAGRIPGDLVLASRFNAWPAVRELNERAAPGEVVVYIGEHRGAQARFEVLLSDWFDTPLVLAEIRRTASNEELLRDWRERGVRHVLYNGAELRLYREAYYRPRFTAQEWARHEALLDALGITDRDALQVVELGE